VAWSKSFCSLSATAAILCLAACAAREVTPVAMSQAGDEQLSCTELNDQLAANVRDVHELLKQDKACLPSLVIWAAAMMSPCRVLRVALPSVHLLRRDLAQQRTLLQFSVPFRRRQSQEFQWWILE